MKCGRHSSIRSWLSSVLVVILGSGGWWLAAGDEALADTTGRAVGLCCAWGGRLKDGVLTYSVSTTVDEPEVLSILHAAVRAWDDALPELELREKEGKRKDRANIVIVYGPGTADGGEGAAGAGARGLTVSYLNRRRMIIRVEIGIDGGPAPVSAGAVEQIAKHEVGHALGLAHANWDGDLMSPFVPPTPGPIPACDIHAVIEANSWHMADQARRPKPPETGSVPC